MSKYLTQDVPFFDNAGNPLAFGKVYFGRPNTDPTDQENNAKAPFVDSNFTTATDSLITLDIAGKLPNRLYLIGAYSITVTDQSDVVIDSNPNYVGESTDQISNDSSVAGATLSAALETLSAAIASIQSQQVSFENIWPVGALYFTTTNENPSSRLGFGTWVAYAQGRVLVGAGQGTDDNNSNVTFAADDEGGEYTHSLAEEELPEHQHALFSSSIQSPANSNVGVNQVAAFEFADSGNNDQYIIKSAAIQTATVGVSGPVGDGDPINNIQPYITAYIWRRTE